MSRTRFFITAFSTLILLAACGGTAPQTPTEPAPPTPTFPPPTASPAPTHTPLPSPSPEAAPLTETPATDANAPATISFAANVMPILEAKCIKCHGVETTKEGLNLLTYDNLMSGSFNGPVLIPGNADESLMVLLIVRGKMPNRGTKATPEELQTIIDWVDQGALNN